MRAFQPWPESYTGWRGKQLKIVEAVPLVAEGGDFRIGQVVALSPSEKRKESTFGVQTGSGVLGVDRVQMEGKRIMSAAEFLRGQREFIGAILPSG